MPANVLLARSRWSELLAPVPTPRTGGIRRSAGGASLDRVRSLASPCRSRGHRPVRVRMPNGSFLRRAPACADTRRSPTR